VGRRKGSKNKKGMEKLLQIQCPICGSTFAAYPSYHETPRKFCSVACYRKSRKGWQPSDETRQKLCESRKGKRPGLGLKPSPEHRKKLSEALKGSKSYLWKGGVNPEHDSIRKSVEYKIWREQVYKRDNYTCQRCGSKNGNGKAITLNAHHVQLFSKEPEQRFEVENGVTLCRDCHIITHIENKQQKEVI